MSPWRRKNVIERACRFTERRLYKECLGITRTIRAD